MCKIYGYARVSTQKQNIERQKRNISEAYPNAVIICDEYTGTKMTRPNWSKLYAKVKSGDTIVFDSVSRMSRDAEEGFKVYEELFDRGVELVFLKEHHIDTETYRSSIDQGEAEAVSTGDEDNDFLVNGMMDIIREYILRLAKKQIKLAFEQAEKEVRDLQQRTKEGIETARLAGKQIGLTEGQKLTTKKSVSAKEVIRTHSKSFGGTLSDAECIKLTGVSRNSFYKYKREISEEIG